MKKGKLSGFISYFILIGGSILAGFPLLWIISSSFKSPGELTNGSISLIPKSASLHYYKRVFELFGFHINIINSISVALAATVIAIAISCLAAYGIVRFLPKVGKVMTRVLITTYMFPPILLVIPYSIIMGNLNLSNTRIGLMITYLSFSIPYAIWLLVGFFRTVPKAIEEAAMIDGASKFKVFYKIALPIIAPGVVATAIYTFINAWNEFLFSLILINSTSKMTVSVAVYSIAGGEILEWGDMMAASVLVILPSVVFFLLIQKKIAGGLAQGSVK